MSRDNLRLYYEVFDESHMSMHQGRCEREARAETITQIEQLRDGSYVCDFWKRLCKNGHVALVAYGTHFDCNGTVIQRIPVLDFLAGNFEVLAIWERSVESKPLTTCCPCRPTCCPRREK